MERINNLYIKGTSKTPEIDFTSGVLHFSGRSIPEDAVSFYQPIVKWVERYFESPEKLTKVTFNIEYINSGSNRFIYNILKIVDDNFKKGVNITINWYYEEDDDIIRSLGQDFRVLLTVPFNLVIST
jgi:hypothetical protein